jgi:hypothetical protein
MEPAMNRRVAVAIVSMLAVGAAGLTPALAATGKAKPKPLKGSWSFTDFTPDPTITVVAQAKMVDPYCHGTLPAGPSDVNAHSLKVKGRGTLTVNGSNTGDWAMEVRDAKGRVLAGSDGSSPTTQEGALLTLAKAGTYTVVFCNLTGAPTAKATYTYKYH